MMYTAMRLGIDVVSIALPLRASFQLCGSIVYWFGKYTYDGTYYLVYGHQDSQQEKMEKHIKFLEMKIEEKSFQERENNKILLKLAEKNGIKIEDMIKEIEEDIVLIN